ncbi:lipopolysaccharide biosynthesis protein [Methylocella sp.]|uniref:lipopolysaccharide biosynthesis protein n=1 Tax=Methylocella sp. TaxID=1978226 RepID=UPI0037849B28
MLRRIILGLGANAFGQAVTIAIQLFSLPLFLYFWDPARYGSWLLLSAIPAYVMMADVGMVTAAGNKMAMAIGRADVAEANRVYQSAQLFMTIVCGGLALILAPAVLLLPLPSYMTMDMRVALAALLCGVLTALYGGLAEAAFRATGRYAVGTMLGQIARLAEFAGYMLGLALFRTFSGVALTGFLGRAIGAGVTTWLSQRDSQGLRLGFSAASREELKSIIRPALSFMVFPIANALSFQGVTLLVGALSGTTAVALFNTYRTIARIAVQVTAMFSHALGPEFSRLYGEGGAAAVRRLYQRSAALSAAQSAALSLILYFVAPFLLEVWTHGRIPFVPGVMAWLLAYAAVGGIWHVPRIFLMSTNRHIGLSGWSFVAALLSVVVAFGLGHVLGGVEGAAIGMFLSEAFIACVCVYIARLVLREADPGAPAEPF